MRWKSDGFFGLGVAVGETEAEGEAWAFALALGAGDAVAEAAAVGEADATAFTLGLGVGVGVGLELACRDELSSPGVGTTDGAATAHCDNARIIRMDRWHVLIMFTADIMFSL